MSAAARALGLLNRLFRRHVGGAQRPAFFDVDATYPALRLLDRNYAVIREELLAVLQDQERIPRYHEISKAETYISGTVDPTRIPAHYNTSPERRVVLIVDVVRPMAWPLHVINWLVTRVLARYSEEVQEIRANATRYANRL
jgi:aspartyl/asparaginyl beta-hydroxylase (cupin superfamily)